MKCKILVTGGAGFIGSHLVERLIREGCEVTVLDNLLHGSKLDARAKEQVRFVHGDVRDADLVDKVTRNCRIVFHLAAYLGVDMVARHPVETMDVESRGTYNVVQSAIRHDVKKMIYVSTSGVYGKLAIEKAVDEDFLLSPSSSYSISKRFNEIYLQSIHQKYGLQTFSLRYFNVYGPRQDDRMVIPRFFFQALNNDPVVVFGSGRQTRDFTYIDDVVESTVRVAEKGSGSEIINIANGNDISILGVAEQIVRLTGSDSRIRFVEPPSGRAEFDVLRRCGCSDKLERITGYRPATPLELGLKKTWEHIQNNLFAPS